MTTSSTGTGEEGGAVDRRWFEEALRSQGFVVEPPDVETQSPVADAAMEDPGAAGPVAVAEATTSADERPPVPSALLARIASRGQGPATVAPSEPDAAGSSGKAAGGVPGTVAAAEATAVPPWEVAVPAVVAPWSAAPEAAAPEPAAPEPAAAAPIAVEPAAAVPIAVEPEAPEPIAARPSPVIEPPPLPVVTPEPVSVPAEAPVEPASAPVPPPAAAALLESPYAPAPTATEVSPVAPSPIPSAGPEADEGGLWALVGSSEPAAVATSRRSEAVRVALTILTAIVIIVIVVGSLVLASQLV